MENGIIPLRHGSLPGSLKLPKRYEDLARGRQMSPSCSGNLTMASPDSDTDSKRFNDLMQAILWVKQELVLMRQHDILLKRQFCDIQETINSLNKSRNKKNRNNLVSTSNSSLQSNGSSDFDVENYSVRSASSVTALHEAEVNDNDILSEFRPRTSSMKTTRDLAALARRRGSKELI